MNPLRTPARASALAISVGALCAGAVAGGAIASAPSHRAAAKTPANDSFHGTLGSGRGRFARAGGKASVDLHFRSSGRTRAMIAKIHGQRCKGAGHCLDLHGTVAG